MNESKFFLILAAFGAVILVAAAAADTIEKRSKFEAGFVDCFGDGTVMSCAGPACTTARETCEKKAAAP